MYIEIEKESIPYRFDMELADDLFTFEIHYNERFDFFTVNVERDGEPLASGQKMSLNRPLFSSLTDERLPKVFIVPLDESGEQSRITYDNLEDTVFLFVGEAVG